jgi:hypothetical protein
VHLAGVHLASMNLAGVNLAGVNLAEQASGKREQMYIWRA